MTIACFGGCFLQKGITCGDKMLQASPILKIIIIFATINTNINKE